jgi:hypothetical protein
LNVNGTGAKPITNRAYIALNAKEIITNKAFGVVYDGAQWRVITPVSRIYAATNPANPTVECAGYDAISFWANFNSATGAGVTLAHVGWGVPVLFKMYNGTGAAISYYVNITDPTGASPRTFVGLTTATTGVGAALIDSTAGTFSLTSACQIVFSGMLAGTGEFWFR